MVEDGRGLELWKILVEADTAQVWDGVQALNEVRGLWLDVCRRRPTRADTEELGELLGRVELALGANARWMAELRRSIPHLFRIVCANTPPDP